MLEKIVRKLCSYWELPDNSPTAGTQTTVIAGMTLSPTTKGELGWPAEKVVKLSVEKLRQNIKCRILVSNRWPIRDEVTLADKMKEYAVRCGAPYHLVIVPNNFRNNWVRNTQKEAEFVILHVDGLDSVNRKSILVIANNIHMRRVIATFKKALVGSNIDLYWQSVRCDEGFGLGFVQKRFTHPLLFLCYEILALSYSKITKIA